MKSVVFQLDQFRVFDVCAMFLPQVLSNFWSLQLCSSTGLSLDFSFVEGLLRGRQKAPSKVSLTV